MFFDLNVPIPSPGPSTQSGNQSRKGKGKRTQESSSVAYSVGQLSAIEARLDLLVHLGYSVIALSQVAYKKIDGKSHVNVLDGLLAQLRKRPGIIFLKRLTIILDEESEKGFGLTSANAAVLMAYDLIALTPTTHGTFSLACLTHSMPSPQTAHVIAIPLTQPRLPFHLKHTLVRTAIKNGAVFEINYAGAVGGESDPGQTSFGDEGGVAGVKRNWWAAAREVIRVTKGKGILVSGGVVRGADVRGPRDVVNLITLLGVAQNIAQESSTKTAKSLVLRAQTRKTYRAILSEPKWVLGEKRRACSVDREDETKKSRLM